MVKVIEPNYVHYTRIKSIPATDAQKLLAIFELRDKEFSNEDERNRLFEIEMDLADTVLCEAFDALDNKGLKYFGIDHPFDQNNIVPKGWSYNLNNIGIIVVEFCSWALELKYNLPEEFVKLVKSSACNVDSKKRGDQITEYTQKVDESQKIDEVSLTEASLADEHSETKTVLEEVVIPETGESQADDDDKGTSPTNAAQEVNPKFKNKGGKHKGSLAQAVEHAYSKLLNKGNIAVLKAGELRGFLKCLKEMATEGNENVDEYIIERIEIVKVPKVGQCSIQTKERRDKTPPYKIIAYSASYKDNAVSKLLTDLRVRFSLTT